MLLSTRLCVTSFRSRERLFLVVWFLSYLYVSLNVYLCRCHWCLLCELRRIGIPVVVKPSVLVCLYCLLESGFIYVIRGQFSWKFGFLTDMNEISVQSVQLLGILVVSCLSCVLRLLMTSANSGLVWKFCFLHIIKVFILHRRFKHFRKGSSVQLRLDMQDRWRHQCFFEYGHWLNFFFAERIEWRWLVFS